MQQLYATVMQHVICLRVFSRRKCRQAGAGNRGDLPTPQRVEIGLVRGLWRRVLDAVRSRMLSVTEVH